MRPALGSDKYTALRRPMIRAGIGFLAGVAIALPAIMLAIASVGAGHGHYTAARALFPFSMLSTLLTRDQITTPLIVLAVIQFPAYGAAIGAATTRRLLAYVVGAAIITIHVIAAWLCFGGLFANFG